MDEATHTPVLQTTTGHTQVMGVDIFHEELGSGPPLVLLHGLNASHRTWRRVAPLLAATHHVIMPDLPGCGLSGRPDADYTLPWQAQVMCAWLDARGLGEVDVAGHSYGGGLAQYMLLLDCARIRRLALVASGGLGREVAFELRLASFARIVELFGQPFMSPFAATALRSVGGIVAEDEEDWLREINARPGTARAFARTVRDVIDWRGQRRHFLDHGHQIRRLPPIALFWGSCDRIIPHAQVDATMQILRGAELTTFRGCGHFPHQERPHDFARALSAFVDREHAEEARLAAPPAAPQTSLLTKLLGEWRRTRPLAQLAA